MFCWLIHTWPNYSLHLCFYISPALTTRLMKWWSHSTDIIALVPNTRLISASQAGILLHTGSDQTKSVLTSTYI